MNGVGRKPAAARVFLSYARGNQSWVSELQDVGSLRSSVAARSSTTTSTSRGSGT